MDEPDRKPGKRVRLLLTPVIVLFTIELVTRGLFWAQGNPYDGALTLQAIERTVSAMVEHVPRERGQPDGGRRDPWMLHPYCGFDAERGVQMIEADLAHFGTGRGAETFDIVILGGSVAGGFSNHGRERLLERLRQDPRLARAVFRVRGYARAAHKQPQQMMLLSYLLALGVVPDAVICIEGYNEVALGNANLERGVHPLYPAIFQWGAVARGSVAGRAAVDLLLRARRRETEARQLARGLTRFGLHRSSVLGRWALHRVSRIKRDWTQVQLEYVALLSDPNGGAACLGPAFEGEAQDAVVFLVASWMRTVRMMQAVCDEHSIAFLPVLQPNLNDRGSKALTQAERALPPAPEAWIQGATLGYPLLREAGRTLAREGVRFVDASMAFAEVEETLYFDSGHFVRAGHELLAERIAEALLATLPPDGAASRGPSKSEGAAAERTTRR